MFPALPYLAPPQDTGWESFRDTLQSGTVRNVFVRRKHVLASDYNIMVFRCNKQTCLRVTYAINKKMLQKKKKYTEISIYVWSWVSRRRARFKQTTGLGVQINIPCVLDPLAPRETLAGCRVFSRQPERRAHTE